MKLSIKNKPFFNDAQIKRMLVQLMSAFAGYRVRTGYQRDGKQRMLSVPIIYGDPSNVFSYSINGGSDNTMPTLPMMSLYMTSLKRKDAWLRQPQHWERFRYTERARDADGNLLVNVPGKKMIVERFMPVPFDLGFEVSIWASNNDQGYQVVEQILAVFGDSMEVQLSNSPADWAFLTDIFFSGDVQFEKAIANIGGAANPDPMYLYTLPFSTVIWISAPVKVYEAKPIYHIHVPIFELEDEFDFDTATPLDGITIHAEDEDETN